MFGHSQIQVGHKTSIIFGFKRYFKNDFIKWILFCPLWHYHCRHYSFSSDQSNRIRQVMYAKVMRWWRLRNNFKIQFSSDVTKCIPHLNIFLPPNHRPALSVPARKPSGVPQVMAKKTRLQGVTTEGLHQSQAGTWAHGQRRAGSGTCTSQMATLSPGKTLILPTFQFSHTDALLRDCQHSRKRGPDRITILSFGLHSGAGFWTVLKAADITTVTLHLSWSTLR